MSSYVLTAISAQMIVDYIMQNTSNNINIMDSRGIIIASGHKDRIGSVHKGAAKALSYGKINIVYENTATEKKGINIPIDYNGENVGVIGISGEVQDVLPLGQMVLSIAQLMIENQIYMEMSAIKGSRIQDFLFEWSRLEEKDYSAKFHEQARYFGINLTISRTAVLIVSRRTHYSIVDNIKQRLEKDEYLIRLGVDQMTILLRSDSNLEQRLKKIMETSKDITGCYIGEAGTNVKYSSQSAIQACEMAHVMKLKKEIIKYSELSLECMFEEIILTNEIKQIIQIISGHDMKLELVETICAYVEYTDSIKSICDMLHIHRNTLNYRLLKLENITGFNIRKGKDMMKLYMAAIYILNNSVS